jgi:SIR2-like domain
MSIRTTNIADLPDALAQRFLHGDGVLWTGAGVSARPPGAGPSAPGVPGGLALESHLRKRLGRISHLRAGIPLEELADRYIQEHDHDRRRLNRLIRSVYSARGAVAPAFYNRVAELPDCVRQFITTNYDPFLERALAGRGAQLVVRGRELSSVSSTRPVVYKVHGDAGRPDECVIATSDYNDWDTTSGNLPALLSSQVAQKTIVALGYSARDRNIQRLVATVANAARSVGDTPQQLYVVVSSADVGDFAVHDAASYETVLVNSTGEAFLNWLTERLREVARADAAAVLGNAIVDSPAVVAARRQMESASGGTQLGLAFEHLGGSLRAAGRTAEALQAYTNAVRHYRAAGDTTRAQALEVPVVMEALEGLNDAQFACRLAHWMQTTIKLGDPPFPRSRALEMALALAEAMTGVLGRPDPPADSLVDAATSPTSGADRDSHTAEVEALAAEIAVTNLRFEDASRHYALAAHANTAHGSRRQVADLQLVRAELYRGLSDDPRSAWSSLQVLVVARHAEESRLRASGWMAALAGETEASVNAFQAAAALALRDADPIRAASAYRGAEWAERMALTSFLAPSGRSAYRLEQLQGSLDAACETPRRLLARVDRMAGEHASLRSRSELAHAALRLAYQDIDPASVYDGQRRLATIWLQVVASESDDMSVTLAAYYTGTTLVDVPVDDVDGLVAPLILCLATRASTSARLLVADLCVNSAAGVVERTGMLRLMRHLAPNLGQELVDRQAIRAIRRGLESGSFVGRADAATAACELLVTIERFAPAVSLTDVLRDLVAKAPSIPQVRVDVLYQAIAACTRRAELDSRLSIALADLLCSARPTATQRAAIDDSLAALADRASDEIKARVLDVLYRATETGDSNAMATLVEAGREVSLKTCNQFLSRLQSIMNEIKSSSGSAAIPLGVYSPPTAAVRYAAAHAAPDEVTKTCAQALGILEDDGIGFSVRAAWIIPTACLADAGTESIAGVITTLRRFVIGDADEPAAYRKLPTHILSSVRIVLGDAHDVYHLALRALAYLFRRLAVGDREQVLGVIVSAAGSPDGRVRVAAAAALGELAMSIRKMPDADSFLLSSAPVCRPIALLTKMLGDEDAAVRGAARHTLRWSSEAPLESFDTRRTSARQSSDGGL